MPTKDHIYAGTTWDLVQMMQRRSGDALVVGQGSILPNLRGGLAKAAVQQGASHVLFVDSDMRFPANTIDRLLSRDKPIVAANCKDRQHNQWTARRGGQTVFSTSRTSIEKVDTVGCAVMLIESRVFNSLAEPWFSMPWDAATGKHVGEDVFFCNLARRHGYDVWIDHDLSQHVRHAATVEFGADAR